MTNEEIFKKLEAFAENRRDDCSENGETHNTQYWVGYLVAEKGRRRMSIVLFAMIGSAIDAGTFYWVMFAIYCLFQVIGWITKD